MRPDGIQYIDKQRASLDQKKKYVLLRPYSPHVNGYLRMCSECMSTLSTVVDEERGYAFA